MDERPNHLQDQKTSAVAPAQPFYLIVLYVDDVAHFPSSTDFVPQIQNETRTTAFLSNSPFFLLRLSALDAPSQRASSIFQRHFQVKCVLAKYIAFRLNLTLVRISAWRAGGRRRQYLCVLVFSTQSRAERHRQTFQGTILSHRTTFKNVYSTHALTHTHTHT